MNPSSDQSAAAAPLHAILRKEQEVAERLQAARAAAEAQLAAATRAAEELLQAAQARGAADARLRYETGMAAARADADRINRQAQAAAAAIERQGELHLAEAVQRIVDFILPPQEVPP